MLKNKSFNRTIWMLWLQGWENAPPLVQQCAQTWQIRNPGWKVKKLDRSDVDALWTKDQELQVAAKMPESALADLVRMKLLVTHGGVWADATLACSVPLSNWLWILFSGNFFAFSDAPDYRPLDNFFLAAGKGNRLIGMWLQASLNAWAQPSVKSREPAETSSRLARELPRKGKVWLKPDFWNGIEVMPYFWPHYLFDYALKHQASFQESWVRVPKCAARIPIMMDLRNAFDETRVEDHEFEHLLRHNMAPMHKLNWRRMDPETMPRVKALLDQCCGRT